MEFKLPLRNRTNDIIDYTYVSEDDYEILSKFRWCKSGGYAQGKINQKSWKLHRYIMIEILGNDITSHIKIDHIDNDRLNNCRDNLRIVTNSENSRNRIKLPNTTSNYIGVCWDKNMWCSNISINKKTIKTFYESAHHAAYQYNLWCEEFNLYTANLNIIPKEELIGFQLYKKLEKKYNLPKNISLRNNKYRVIINRIDIGLYKTLLEAILVKTLKLREIEYIKEKERLNKPIKRNEYGIAIIEIFNKNKDKIAETLVDDDTYYDLTKYHWSINKENYVKNKSLGRIHRYIMDYNGDNIVDHINNNQLDNRKCNLRIATRQQNMMNKKSAKNSTSKYIGVSYDESRNKWVACIMINGKTKFLGRFDFEIDAAKARDEATKELFQHFGNLNLVSPGARQVPSSDDDQMTKGKQINWQ